jgi:hypothetical protein
MATNPSSVIIIVLVLGFAIYLIYSQGQSNDIVSKMRYHLDRSESKCPPCAACAQNRQMGQPVQMGPQGQMGPPGQMGQQPQYQALPMQQMQQPPTQINIRSENPTDQFSDAIKKQDLYTMYDPLTYPQLRLPREVLERYNDYYKSTGTYPPFNEATQPFLFDNPIMNGILVKIVDDNEPFVDNIPHSVPLFRVQSSTNTNRYFYYVLDNRNFNMLIQPKIPLDNIKINGIRYNNADFYGLPEIFDHDVLEDISIYPGARFKVTLYKTYHFP